MKKIIAALLALFVLCASAACADRIEPEHPAPPLLGTFRETVADLWSLCSDWNNEAIVATVDQNGNYFRVIALYDDHAKALSHTASLLEEYALDLPVSCIERITAKPLNEADLKVLVGKTVSEAAALGYSLCGSSGGMSQPVTVYLSKGFFDYEFEIDVSFEEYTARTDRDEENVLDDLVITGYSRCDGLSSQALDLRFSADGTFNPGMAEVTHN